MMPLVSAALAEDISDTRTVSRELLMPIIFRLDIEVLRSARIASSVEIREEELVTFSIGRKMGKPVSWSELRDTWGRIKIVFQCRMCNLVVEQ